MRAWAVTEDASTTLADLDPEFAPRAQLVVLPPRARTRRTATAKAAMALADAAALALAMFIAYQVGEVASIGSSLHAADYVIAACAAIPVWLLVFARYGLYASRRVSTRLQEFRGLFHALVIGTALLAVGAYLLETQIARRWVLLTLLLAGPIVVCEREITRRVFARMRRRGMFRRTVLIVGANEEGRSIAKLLEDTPSLGYRVIGFVDDTARSNGVAVLGKTCDAAALAVSNGATSAIVATTAIDAESSNRIARQLIDAGVHVELSSSLRDIRADRLVVRSIGPYPVVYLEPVRRGGWRAVAKRTFDIVMSATALFLLSPFMFFIAVAIKFDSRGPVFFRQRRVGRNGDLFTIYKFRTMVADAERRLSELEAQNEADGVLFKMRDDPRVTRVGKLLRRISLDELPQFWNVLRGEMSLVGPRPALPHEALLWAPALRQRLRVKPGVTGMWQVSGRSNSSFEAYARHDLFYVDNWSLVTDLAIIGRTIPTLLRRDGAY